MYISSIYIIFMSRKFFLIAFYIMLCCRKARALMWHPWDNLHTSRTVCSSSSSYIDLYENKNYDSVNSGLGTEALIYVDADIIVVDKPSFAQTAPGYIEQDSVATRMKDLFDLERTDHMVSHRLDYGTSGILVLARNVHALKELNAQFRNDVIFKRYSAIVHGVMHSYEGEIDLPLGRDPDRGPPLQRVTSDGKRSLTHWRVREVAHGKTHVHLTPKTGRTHQLRLHLASIGHPILGDLFYAPMELYLASHRLLLHAEELRMKHPRLGTPMRFISTCPFHLDDYPAGVTSTAAITSPSPNRL